MRGSRTWAAHVKTHQAFEARIHIFLGQNLAVDIQHFWWRKCFLCCDAQIWHFVDFFNHAAKFN